MKNVLKFGGSSVAGPSQIRCVVDIVRGYEQPCAVIVSALGGITDGLKNIAQKALTGEHAPLVNELRDRHQRVINDLLTPEANLRASDYLEGRIAEVDIICRGIHMLQELSDRSLARMLSFGELVSSFIVTEAIKEVIPTCQRIDARKFILTDDKLMKATVDRAQTTLELKSIFSNINSVAVIPGFIGATKNKVTSTLGRGGSDYTASLIAAALDVQELHIYSDVSGMLSANPRAVIQAKNIDHLSYNEAFELSHFGAKVLYPPAIQPAYEKNIALLLKNTFDPTHPGTRIDMFPSENPEIVTGISSIDDVAMVNLSGIGMIGVTGYSSRVFNALHQHDINVIMIAQSCSERGICIAVDKGDVHNAEHALQLAFEEEIALKRIDPIQLEENLSIVALVGDGMKFRSGVSGQIFSQLGNYNINIRAIAQGSSESNISIIIDSKDEMRAIKKLHEKFIEKRLAQINLFVLGAGNVGTAFLNLLDKSKDAIASKYGVELTICGLSNSRKMVLDGTGIEPENALERLGRTKTNSDLNKFLEFAVSIHSPNRILVDNTASDATTTIYNEALARGIHVVTCNKRMASGPFEHYSELLQTMAVNKSKFYFETNVGAALPMIQALSNLVDTGDTVHKFQAILSGSLSYIFDQYDGLTPFVEVVKEAGKLGYTEPNPQDDLSGLDVMRKMVILGRAIGLEVELEDVVKSNDLPEECQQAEGKESFLSTLTNNESYFKAKYENAKKENCKLKYIAEYSNGKLQVGLQAVNQTHVFYTLEGTDNILAIYSNRYKNPFIIRGAGAGPENTASGVLTDILRINSWK